MYNTIGQNSISWTVSRSFARHSRQVTMPATHCSMSDALSDAHSTLLKH